MRFHFHPASAIIVGLPLLASELNLARPAENDEQQRAAPVSNSGPFKPDLHEPARQPSGVIPITGELVRSWRDCFGNRTEGRLVGLQAAMVFLIANGEALTVALPALCTNDREYVRSVLRACGKVGLFPGEENPKDEATTMRLTVSQWQRQLSQWIEAVNDGVSGDSETAEEAWNHLRHVRDPIAMTHLRALVTRDANATVRTACVEAIAAIGGPEATRLLVKLAVTDRSVPVRASATWALCHFDDPSTTLAEYTHYIRAERFRDPALMSLQATGIVRRLNSDEIPDAQLTDALIGILVLKVTRVTHYESWWGYGSPGGPSHYHWERRPVFFQVPVPCEMARKLLVQHTGEDYGYDQQAWRCSQARAAVPQPKADVVPE